jgi:putative acetyltransferase
MNPFLNESRQSPRQYIDLEKNVIVNHSNESTGLNVSSLGLMTAEDVVLATMTDDELAAVGDMIRVGIGAYEEAGTVLASTFRRLDRLKGVYEAPGSIYIVARDKRGDQESRDTHVIGGAGLGPLHGLSPAEGLGEIRDLVVRPEWRGHGIGARLLKRCLDEAKRLGYQRLYLEATPQMEQAQKLFIRYGFRPVTTGSARVTPGESMPCYYILETLS